MKELNFEKLICLVNNVWRLYQMRQQAMGFMKGICCGILAGVAIGAVGSKQMNNNRGLRRRADKTMRAVGDLLGSVQEIFH